MRDIKAFRIVRREMIGGMGGVRNVRDCARYHSDRRLATAPVRGGGWGGGAGAYDRVSVRLRATKGASAALGRIGIRRWGICLLAPQACQPSWGDCTLR